MSQAIASHGRTRVVVALRPTAMLAGIRPASAVHRQQVANRVDSTLARLPPGSYVLLRRFATVPALALEIDADALTALRADADVARVDVDVGGHGHMNQAAPLARIDAVRDFGYTGQGVTVAVIDSGVDLQHPDLADSLVDQHCFSSPQSGSTGGNCPNGQAQQAGAGSGAAAAGHGTNVAGIFTGNGSIAPRGGSPDADLIAIRLLDSQDRFYTTSDIVASLDWLATYHPEVRVINMSLGTSALFTGTCDNATGWTMALKAAVDAVMANGAIVGFSRDTCKNAL